MGTIQLVWAGLWRRRARTIFALLSAIAAFLLFGVLNGVHAFLQQTVERAHLDILVTNNPGGLPMPLAYHRRISNVAGIKASTYIAPLIGYVGKPSNHVTVLMTDPAQIFQINADMQATPSDLEEISRTRIGVLATAGLARDNGWKKGNMIFVHSNVTPQKNGRDWQFQIVGTFTFSQAPNAPILIANYSYGDAARAANAGTALQFWSLIGNPARAGAVSGAIDDLFSNSPAQTRTMSQKDATQSAMSRIGNIDFFLNAIIAAVFFTLLLMLGNVLMQSFRERTREFGLLKTVGFSDRRVASLLIGEAVLLCLGAAIIGLSGAWFILPIFAKATGGVLPHPPAIIFADGLLAAILVGVVCGVVPAWKVSRLTIVETLRRPT
jgi:putative ABC transport system permease protein